FWRCSAAGARPVESFDKSLRREFATNGFTSKLSSTTLVSNFCREGYLRREGSDQSATAGKGESGCGCLKRTCSSSRFLCRECLGGFLQYRVSTCPKIGQGSLNAPIRVDSRPFDSPAFVGDEIVGAVVQEPAASDLLSSLFQDRPG